MIGVFIKFFMVGMICITVHLGSRLLLSWLVGAKVIEVGFFFGPTLFQFRWRGITWKIGTLPLGNYAQFDNDDASPDRFESLPLWKRLAIHGSGVAGLFVLASACLGPRHAWASNDSGFAQIFRCLGTPGFARTLIDRLYDLIRADSAWPLIGIMAAKLATMNMMPVLPSDGGNFLFDLIHGKKWIPEQASSFLSMIWVLVAMVLMIFLGYTFLVKVIWP